MNNDMFDFGFTSVTLDELDDYQEAKSQVDGATAENAVILERMDKLYNAFLPLLSNLKKDAGKDYILWPNRLEKIEEFEEVLYNIYSGKWFASRGIIRRVKYGQIEIPNKINPRRCVYLEEIEFLVWEKGLSHHT